MDLIKKVGKWIGRLVSILSVIYVAVNLFEMEIDDSIFPDLRILVLAILIFSFMAMLCNCNNAFVWKRFLSYLTKRELNTREIICVYLKANITKYLPGNVFQYVGRNVLGKEKGILHKTLITASVMELVIISISTLFFAIFFSMNHMETIYEVMIKYANEKIIMMVLFICGIVIIGMLLMNKNVIKKYLSVKNLRCVLEGMGLYFVSNIISCVILCGIFHCVLMNTLSFKDIAFANAVSWLAGYVVPGSPGGIGVRELVFIFLFEGYASREIVIVAIVLFRLCGIMGDVISWLFAIGMETYDKRKVQ